MSTHVDSELLISYEAALEGSRSQIKEAVFALFKTHGDAEFWYRFLVAYCAQGVHMTQDVPNWIRRAGEQAVALGSVEFGEILMGHAKHEAGHHELFVDDVASLRGLYAGKFGKEIAAAAIPFNPPFASVNDYIALHENIIASDLPLRQAALEFEIEMLSVSVGGDLIGQWTTICGKDILQGLSFLTEHVAADVGHTKFNKILLNRILLENPEALPKFVETGKEALKIYTAYLLEVAHYAAEKMG